MSDRPTELAAAIREAIDSGETRVIAVPNETRKALAERALARTGTADDATRITFRVVTIGE
jgi:hypothetical protein